MLIPILIGTALYYVYKEHTGIKKTTTSISLSGPTAASTVKLGDTVGVFPPAGASIISVSVGVPATKAPVIATAIAPVIAKVVPPAAVAPMAMAAAKNITSDMPTTLATVTDTITPAVAAIVPPASVPAAANAAAANIVSSVPTSQVSLAAAIAPTLLDTVHPDSVDNVANAAASQVNLSLTDAKNTMAATMAPAIAAVTPVVAVPAAAEIAATTTMAGEAGSFMMNPRHMQSWIHGEAGNLFMREGRHHSNPNMWEGRPNRIFPEGRIRPAYGRSFSSSYSMGVEEAIDKAGDGRQAILKPTTPGSTLYTVAWKDATGTKSTIVNVTVAP